MDQRVAGRMILAFLLTLAACGGDSPSNPSGSDYYVSARIDGVAWEADRALIFGTGAGAVTPGWIAFQASSLGSGARSLAMNLARIPGPGTYPLGVNTGTHTGGLVTVSAGSQGWNTPFSGAAGSVTIATITDAAVTGTFQFNADPVGGGGTSMSVVDGRFRVPSTGYVAATADQVGNSMSATVAGASWTSATLGAVGSPQSLFTFTASNDRYTISVAMGPVTTTGAAPLSTGLPIRSVSVQRAGGGSWGGSAADQGTMTITSLSATRIAGTFSGTLAAGAGTAGTLQIAEARFDVRLVQ
jgi:hypothetical protein